MTRIGHPFGTLGYNGIEASSGVATRGRGNCVRARLEINSSREGRYPVNVEYSNTGEYLVADENSENLNVFDDRGGQPEQIERLSLPSKINGVAFDEHDDRLAVGGDNYVYVFDTSDWSPTLILTDLESIGQTDTERVAKPLFVPDGRIFLYMDDWSAHHYVIDDETGELLIEIEEEVNDTHSLHQMPNDAAITGDGKYVVCTDSFMAPSASANGARAVALDTENFEYHTQVIVQTLADRSAHEVQIAGNTVAISVKRDDRNELWIVDYDPEDESFELDENNTYSGQDAETVAVGPEGNIFLRGWHNGQIRIYNRETMDLADRLITSNTSNWDNTVYSVPVAISPDGESFAYADDMDTLVTDCLSQIEVEDSSGDNEFGDG